MYGQCSVTCGEGTFKKYRYKSVEEKNGGTCSGEEDTIDTCMTPCPGMKIQEYYSDIKFIACLLNRNNQKNKNQYPIFFKLTVYGVNGFQEIAHNLAMVELLQGVEKRLSKKTTVEYVQITFHRRQKVVMKYLVGCLVGVKFRKTLVH